VPVQWTDEAIAHARQEMAQSRIFAVFDDDERQAQRAVGRRLLGLVLQYAGARDQAEDLLAEAAAIGETYARLSLNHRQALVDLLRAIGLFKDALLEAAALQPTGPDQPPVGDGGRLVLRIGRLLDEVQIGAVRQYESGSRV
jgi:hypothetical protein